MNIKSRDTKLILPDIRSVHNVGTFFRTANALGINEIILTGITPTPYDKYGRLRSDFQKVALGAEKDVLFRYESDLKNELIKNHKGSRKIIAIEQSPNSKLYTEYNHDGSHITFILGNEVEGLLPEILELADEVLEIPMQGSKESLNVTIAGAIVMSSIIHR